MAADQKISGFKIDLSADEQQQALASFAKILQSGWLTLGPYTQEFEAGFGQVVGSPHAVAVGTGTVALEIIVRILGVTGRVLMPSNTNYATAAAVSAAGARPVLYDGGLYPDLNDFRAKLEQGADLAIVVHIGGYITPDIAAMQQLCADYGVPLVEDAAHAHGSQSAAGAAGTLGRAAAFSFFPTKVLTTGEGGMITTADPGLAQAARQYRDQGKAEDGLRNVVVGSSWRLSELQAALGVAQLPGFAGKLQRRRAILQRYCQGIEALQVAAVTMAGQDHHQASGHKAILRLPGAQTRDQLRHHLQSSGINTTKGVYDVPLHRQPVFASLNAGSYPLAENFASRHLCLPIWSGMELSQADQVVASIADFLGRAA